MTKYWLIGLIVLVGCSNIDPYEPMWYQIDELEFDWVEPVIFQHNLMICRQQDVCLAENLFE
jgi:hypothetical protein